MSKADIAVVGLAVMGENLILNMESKGFTVACFNRTVSKVDDFHKWPCQRQKYHRMPIRRRNGRQPQDSA